MYKIYINETPLQLLSEEEKDQLVPAGESYLLTRYHGLAKLLLSYVDMLEKTDRYKAVSLYHSDVDQLFADLQTHYKIIEAAGGIVYNSKGEILFIFRRGFWDLPKGKLDPGESPEQAAIREVQEETGLKTLVLGERLPNTYHTYRDGKNRRVLKRTYWFKMTTPEEALVPQTEEDIEEACWLSMPAFRQKDGRIYASLADLLGQNSSQ